MTSPRSSTSNAGRNSFGNRQWSVRRRLLVSGEACESGFDNDTDSAVSRFDDCLERLEKSEVRKERDVGRGVEAGIVLIGSEGIRGAEEWRSGDTILAGKRVRFDATRKRCLTGFKALRLRNCCSSSLFTMVVMQVGWWI